MIPMRSQRAASIQIGITAIEREIKTLNVEANLCDLYGADHTAAIQASKRRQELRNAAATLKVLANELGLKKANLEPI